MKSFVDLVLAGVCVFFSSSSFVRRRIPLSQSLSFIFNTQWFLIKKNKRRIFWAKSYSVIADWSSSAPPILYLYDFHRKTLYALCVCKSLNFPTFSIVNIHNCLCHMLSKSTIILQGVLQSKVHGFGMATPFVKIFWIHFSHFENCWIDDIKLIRKIT